MKKPVTAAIVMLGLLASSLPAALFGQDVPKPNASNRDYAKWENEVAAYENADRRDPPPKGCILFIGSSTIRLWKTLAEDFPEHKVINRGSAVPRLSMPPTLPTGSIFPTSPNRFFFGPEETTFTPDALPEKWQATSSNLSARSVPASQDRNPLHRSKPSTRARGEGDKARELNRLIREAALEMPRVGFVDAYDISLIPDGQARSELFVKDRLHFAPDGYKLLTERVRPFLGNRDFVIGQGQAIQE